MSSPIELGAVIRKVFRIYVDQASVLMPAAAVVFVITGVLTQVIVESKSAGLSVLVLIIDLLAGTLFTGMVVELVADVQDGRRDASAGQLLRAVTPVLGELILVGIVTGVLEAIGFVLFLIPGLILVTIWSVVAPVVVVEHPGGLHALSRSRALVRGNGWRVFSVIVVLVLAVVIASGLLDALAESAGSGVGLVVRVAIGVLTAPISALAAAVLYFELRGGPRREEEAVAYAPMEVRGAPAEGAHPPLAEPVDPPPPGVPGSDADADARGEEGADADADAQREEDADAQREDGAGAGAGADAEAQREEGADAEAQHEG